MVLNNEEMMNINGGGFSKGLFGIFGSLSVFILGFIDGFVSPLRCNR